MDKSLYALFIVLSCCNFSSVCFTVKKRDLKLAPLPKMYRGKKKLCKSNLLEKHYQPVDSWLYQRGNMPNMSKHYLKHSALFGACLLLSVWINVNCVPSHRSESNANETIQAFKSGRSQVLWNIVFSVYLVIWHGCFVL